MTSSGTTNFNPAIGEMTLYAYSLAGIRRTAITQEHLMDARMAANLMLSSWDNDTPNLWKVDLVQVTLVQGQQTYPVDPATIMVLDAYTRIIDGNGNPIDSIIWPLSRTEYASMPNKLMQGRVTSYWFDRLLSPTITLWQVPDGNGPYSLQYYRVSQIFDADLQGGQTIDIDNSWLDAFAFGLAYRLAISYAMPKVQMLKGLADQALLDAKEQNTENVNMYIAPSVGGYYSR